MRGPPDAYSLFALPPIICTCYASAGTCWGFSLTFDSLAQRARLRADRVSLGILFMLGATVMFAVSSALSKWQVAEYSFVEVLFFRATPSLFTCAAAILPSARCRAGQAHWRSLPTHGIAVGEVLTSPYCRCIDTGMFAFGRATPVQYLRPPGTVSEGQAKLNQERVVQEILKHRGPANLVMITHDLNISDVVLEDTVPVGEFFVVQPTGADFAVIGKIRLNGQ